MQDHIEHSSPVDVLNKIYTIVQGLYWALHASKRLNKIYNIVQGLYWVLHTSKCLNKIYDIVHGSYWAAPRRQIFKTRFTPQRPKP